MEAFGSMCTSVSAKQAESVFSISTSGLLTGAEGKRSQFLKLPKSFSKSSIHGMSSSKQKPWINCQDCKKQSLRKGSVEAVLIDPTNMNESSHFDYGPLSEDANTARKSSTTTNPSSSVTAKSKAASSMRFESSASAENAVQQFSGRVEEVVHSYAAKLKKSRIFLQNAERLRRERIPPHQLRQGGFPENPLMYRQIFVIRSYEVGPEKTTSIREIFSLFQEMALNHVQLLGIAGDGFGATRGINRLGLIWVVTKMQVDVERYPAWPEVIEIDSWVGAAGKNGMRRDWIMRSYQSGEVLARATSTWCMMSTATRRLSKIPDEVRAEIEPNFINDRHGFNQSECVTQRIPKLDDVSAEHHTSQLTSTPTDLDMNQHVNNLKYITWVLESIPVEHVKTHKLASIVLEYRRECHSSDIVESLTSSRTDIDGLSDMNSFEEGEVETAMVVPLCVEVTANIRISSEHKIQVNRRFFAVRQHGDHAVPMPMLAWVLKNWTMICEGACPVRRKSISFHSYFEMFSEGGHCLRQRSYPRCVECTSKQSCVASDRYFHNCEENRFHFERHVRITSLAQIMKHAG